VRTLALLLCVALPVLSATAKENAPKRNRAWVRDQLARWELTREGAPPFRLEARLEVLAQDGSWRAGTYTLLWAASDRWREDLRFPGHEEAEAMAGDVRWWQRPTRYRPRVPGLLTWAIRPEPFETVLAGWQQTPQVACIEHDCVDARSGELRMRLADPNAPHRPDPLVVEFDSTVAFGARSWPRAFHLKEGSREIGRVTLQSLEPLATLSAEQLTPPSAATRVPACLSPTEPRMLPSSKLKPPYPKALAAQGIQGPVRVRFTVAADGSVQDVEVDGPAHPELAALAVDTVRRWRYTPARCGQVPVQVERWLQVDWTMD
jgi:TonB family protein